jgi:hypothetical protein
MSKNSWTKARIQFTFTHRHINTPEEYKFLEQPHRHFLTADVWVEEFGTENDFTPEALEDWLKTIINDITENTEISIPLLGELIQMNINKLYLGNRRMRIDIQDGEGIGHTLEWG